MKQNNNLAPIILFCFNRPDHTLQTLRALQKNDLAKESELIVFCDGPRREQDFEKIKEVYKIIDNISGFKSVDVRKATLNKGLASSVITGVGEIMQKYGKAIILEDDIVTAPNFLTFINDGLNFYKDNEKIFLITGFNYPNYKAPNNYSDDVFFMQGKMSSWGWGSWSDRWEQIDFAVEDFATIKSNKKIQKQFRESGDNFFEMLENQVKGKIDTWDIQISWLMFKKKMFCVIPVKTLVKNIGFDLSGIHCHQDLKMMNFDLDINNKNLKFAKLDDVKNNDRATRNFLKCMTVSFFERTFCSRKKNIRIRYFIFGVVFAELLRFIIT